MALLFSAVTVTSEDDQAEFLVGGIPKTYSELEGWTAFDNLINTVDSEQEIQVHVAACLYGEGEPFNATPEEIAYLTRRAEADDNFFYGHCKHADTAISPSHGHPKNYTEWRWNEMNEYERLRRLAERHRETYPKGTRLMLLSMDDPYSPVPPGTRGSVEFVDDMAQIFMHWDNGRTLPLNSDVDSFRKLTAEELAEEQENEIDEDNGPVMGM